MAETMLDHPNALMTIGILLGLVVMVASIIFYAVYRIGRRWEHVARTLTSELIGKGWVFLVCRPKDQRLLYCRGVRHFASSRQPFSKLQDVEKGVHEEDRERFQLLVANEAEQQEASDIIRNIESERFECIVTMLQWRGEEAVFITLRPVSKAYRKMLAVQSENNALKAQNSLHLDILNTLPHPIWVRDAQLALIYCNLAYLELAEDNEAPSAGQGMPELYRNAEAQARKAQEQQEPEQQRQRLVVDGERRMFEVQDYPSPSGHIIGMAQDIVALDKAEAEIKDHLTTLEDLLDSSSSAMTIYGVDMRLKYYNQAYVRIWGIDEARLQSQPTFSEMLEYLRELRKLPEQVNFPAFKQQRLKIFNEVTEPHEEIFYLPDGRILRNVAIPHSAGGVLFIYEDVTDRLALERSYNTLIAVQQETLDNLFEGVVVFGEDGRLRLKNPVFMSLWELKEEELPDGVHISEMLERTKSLYNVPDWDGFKREFIAQVQSRTYETSRIERQDGAVLDCSMVPLPDGGVLLTYVDMTASTLVERSLRERNEALEAGDKLKTEFLANMSYELRSPLTSISGFAEMLKQDYFGGLSDKQREYVEGIHHSSQNLMHLINDILDLSSIEAGYLTLNISEFDICKMLHAMMTLLGERLREYDVRAEIVCPETIGLMRADETRVRQVLFHLLSNAVKYSHEGGNVVLGAERSKEGVTLWVEDNGVGISEDEQGAVFDKFYRGAPGVRKSGTGLGLSMVKNFVELHGGEVTLESTVGTGTIIRCFFPNEPKPH